ncbi:hypothetical protein LSH36_858g00022 [Paralvinella palmiformis]|uniref:Uncharacterized protein n=1 Tax=Paralvinella palmiformis TaxID=53620 RepID=A0AAD9IYX8_9ANNE|nr:hypothetical protein LSH36_858g00022 [Paralvinella palmiformis]
MPTILRDPDVLIRSDADWSLAKPDLTFISIDLKLGPTYAIKHTLQELGVRIIEKSLSPYCHITDTCSGLAIINQTSALRVTQTDGVAFWKRYRDDAEFQDADGFICIHPVSLCELLMPFRKPVIMIVDDRYEVGRKQRDSWMLWNEHFLELVEETDNVVVTTSAYDMEYVKYFTHVSLPVVPFACEYITERYHPSLPSYLLMPINEDGFKDIILKRFRVEIETYDLNARLEYVFDLYGHSFKSNDLVKHAGLVVIPHQVSSLALTELRRLEIPLFLPTVELLARWQVDFHLMNRSLHDSRQATNHGRQSPILGAGGLPDPNDDVNQWAIGFWLTYCDYFSWPGVRYFNSVEDLASKLNSTTGDDLYYANQKARMFNVEEQANVYHFWRLAVDRLKAAKVKSVPA